MLSQWCLSHCRVDPANGNNKTTVGNPALPQPQQRHFHIVLVQLTVDYPFYFRILHSVINGAIAMCIAYGRALFELNANLLDLLLMRFLICIRVDRP